MMSPTGSKPHVPRPSVYGFSLYELMVAAAILTTGLVIIYESFFRAADAAGSMPYYVKSQILADELIWKSRAALWQNGYLFPGVESGDTLVDKKKVIWTKDVRLINALQGLYEVKVDFSWKSGGKFATNSRTTYLRL